jgi:CBS domain-containing protein
VSTSSNHDHLRPYENSYAAGALEVDQDQTFSRIERGMPVRLIGTLEGLVTTSPEESILEALQKIRLHDFDYLPVRLPDSQSIIGIVSAKMLQTERDGVVAEVYQALGPDDLISAEASLLEFVWSVDQQPRRLVLQGTQIRGIVTLSDIQKLPVRISLFSLFIHFELLLTEHLHNCLRSRSPLEFVAPKRRSYIEKRWKKFSDNRLQQDIFNAMDMRDKRDIAMKLNILGKSEKSIETSFLNIERHLRNPIAHGAEYAISREAAGRTVRAAKEARAWIIDLKKARDEGVIAASTQVGPRLSGDNRMTLP